VFVATLAAFAAAIVAGIPNASSMPDAVRIPIVKPHPRGAPSAAARFRHSTHAQQGCYACHPGIFPRYPLGFTHAEMNEGRYCGSCHDGSGARSVLEMNCETCHAAR
jgi:c(7)-type cytochrome triheme protein